MNHGGDVTQVTDIRSRDVVLIGMGSDSSDSHRLCERSEAERVKLMESFQKPTRERSSEPNRTEPVPIL